MQFRRICSDTDNPVRVVGRVLTTRRNEYKQLVAQSSVENPRQSAKRATEQFDFSRRSLQRFVHALNSKFYRTTIIEPAVEYEQWIRF